MLRRDDLQQMRGFVREEVQEETGPIKKQLALINRKVDRLQKDITFIVNDYGNAVSYLRKRVERIEDHLDVSKV